MGLADELAYMSTVELAGRLRGGELTSVEALDAFASRIEARNPSLNAFVFLALDEARERARQADAALARGDDVGPLHGVPAGLKDLFDFKAGWPATLGGIPALRDFRPQLQCAFVDKAEAAGAIFVGKTNAPVMGMCGATDNPLFGPACNPFDLTRNAGGSSGGSAAAVADGLVPFAEGSDGGGSIRIPASWCGVVGYKPAWGRVGLAVRPSIHSVATPYIHEGPITRTVADAALVLTVINGYDPRDPHTIEGKQDFTGAPSRSIEGMRIAYSPTLGVFPVDPRVATACATAVAAFTEAGAIVEEVELELTRSQRELSDLWCRLVSVLSASTFDAFKRHGMDLLGEHGHDFPPLFTQWVERAYSYTALDLAADQAMRTEVFDAFQRLFEQYDLIVSPTLAALPVENRSDGLTTGPSEVAGERVDPLIGWCMTYLHNFTGHPACSVPGGLAEGLPVGLQVTGKRYGDADVLAACGAFERLRPWHADYARCAGRPLTPVAATGSS